MQSPVSIRSLLIRGLLVPVFLGLAHPALAGAGPTGWWTDYNGNNYNTPPPMGGGTQLDTIVSGLGGMLVNRMVTDLLNPQGQQSVEQARRLEAERGRLKVERRRLRAVRREFERRERVERAADRRDDWDKQDKEVSDVLTGVFDTTDPSNIDPFRSTPDGSIPASQGTAAEPAGLAERAEQWAGRLHTSDRPDLVDRDANFRDFKDRLNAGYEKSGLPDVPKIDDSMGGPVAIPLPGSTPPPPHTDTSTVRLDGPSFHGRVNEAWVDQMRKRAKATMEHHQKLMSTGPIGVINTPAESILQKCSDGIMNSARKYMPNIVNEQLEELRSGLLDMSPRLRELKKFYDYGEGLKKLAPGFLKTVLGEDVAPTLAYGYGSDYDSLGGRVDSVQNELAEHSQQALPEERELIEEVAKAYEDGKFTRDEVAQIAHGHLEPEVTIRLKSGTVVRFKISELAGKE